MLRAELTLAAATAFREGRNVVSYLSDHHPSCPRSVIVEIAYDLQAGSYVAALNDDEMLQLQRQRSCAVTAVLTDLAVNSACEAGVGEATLLGFMCKDSPEISWHGFDLSLSRTLRSKSFLKSIEAQAELFCADMRHIPLPDGSVEAVVTHHALEPNHGIELELLAELLRVTSRYLVLIEPDYERASSEQRARMENHGYIRDLHRWLQELPGKLVRYEPWPLYDNPLNRASILVFEKANQTTHLCKLVSPIGKFPLQRLPHFLYCEEEGLLYPAPFDTPILRDDVSIVGFHLGEADASA